MTNDKLRQLIAEQNDESERQTAYRAKEIIREIAGFQQAKLDADKKIAGLREESMASDSMLRATLRSGPIRPQRRASRAMQIPQRHISIGSGCVITCRKNIRSLS